MSDNRKIWITGSSGMLGKRLCSILKSSDNVILEGNTKIFDQTIQKNVIDWLKINKPDEIIVSSALVGGINFNLSSSAEFLYKNSMIALNIIQAAHDLDIKNLVFLGSSCMYPKNATQPIKEGSLNQGEIEFTNESYGIAKILGVKLIEKINSQYNRKYLTIVPTAAFGPGDIYDEKKSHVIPAMIMKFHNAKLNNIKELTFWGSGEARREFIFVDDMAEGILFIKDNFKRNEMINLGTGIEIKIKKLAYIIAEITGYKGNIIFDKSKPEGVMRKILDNKKIKDLGWKPRYSLEEGLEITYKDYCKNT
tara:strand:+ start:3401 stop:4324 length:924 start_codon:yes stop_codon:yes gene_type:complete